MKTTLFFVLLLNSLAVFADDADKAWPNTVISDAAIKDIQETKYKYKKCVSEEMKKTMYQNQDSRKATDAVMMHCEDALTVMREVYLAAKVPGAIADRHLKQTRIQVTREALQALMFAQATRQAGHDLNSTPQERK